MRKLAFLSLCALLFLAVHSASAQNAAVSPAASPVTVRTVARNAGLSELLWLLKNLVQKYGIILEQEDDYYATILRRDVTAETVKATNFRIRLRLETEPLIGTQYRQSESDGTWGHGYDNSYKFAQAENIPWNVEKAFESPDVPRWGWPYEAMQKLADAGIIEWEVGTYMGNKAMARYEFAVGVARLLIKINQAENQKSEKQPMPLGPDKNVPDDKFLKAIEREENRLLIEKLKEEFQSEINALMRRVNSKSTSLQNTPTPRPHYVYLHLGFAYGTEIDPRLVADVKSLIESYCAVSQIKAQQ